MKIMSVVTFKVKDGYQEEFTDAYRKAGSSSANFWRLVAVGEDTFVSINELPAVEDAVEREEGWHPLARYCGTYARQVW